MSGRTRLDPKEHIPGEWNIIRLNRYMPISEGAHKTSEEISEVRTMAAEVRWARAELVKKAEALYSAGATQTDIAKQIGLSQSTVSLWISRGFVVGEK